MAREPEMLPIEEDDTLYDDMVDDELHSTNGSSDDDQDNHGIQYRDFNAARDMRNPIFF